jgi:hypothetical protein
MAYEIQEYTFCEGWVNTWSTWEKPDGSDEHPETFTTEKEAQEALDDFLAEVNESVENGEMEFGYDPEDFRIEEVL